MDEMKGFYHDPVDEVLEAIWVLIEHGRQTGYDDIISWDRRGIISRRDIDDLVTQGLIVDRGGRFAFSDTGRAKAQSIIRRHRLAERLLSDVLNIADDSEIESDACRFEHFLSPEVTDHICVLLGHPKNCPHGNDIPPGECCSKAESRMESAVVPLSSLACGETGRILYIATQKHERLDRLTSLGLIPGRNVRIHQREPLFVVFIDQTQLALDKSIMEEIHVVRTGAGESGRSAAPRTE